MYKTFFANDLSGKLKLEYYISNLDSLSIWNQTDSKKGDYNYHMSLEEIAKIMKITRERVRLIETRALNKLSHLT